MLEKMMKCAAKNAAFIMMDMVVPGSGYAAKKVCQAMNVAELLGPRATPERVECIMDAMDDAGEFAKDTMDTAKSLLGMLFDC